MKVEEVDNEDPLTKTANMTNNDNTLHVSQVSSITWNILIVSK